MAKGSSKKAHAKALKRAGHKSGHASRATNHSINEMRNGSQQYRGKKGQTPKGTKPKCKSKSG